MPKHKKIERTYKRAKQLAHAGWSGDAEEAMLLLELIDGAFSYMKWPKVNWPLNPTKPEALGKKIAQQGDGLYCDADPVIGVERLQVRFRLNPTASNGWTVKCLDEAVVVDPEKPESFVAFYKAASVAILRLAREQGQKIGPA